MDIIKEALKEKRRTLSEHEAKNLLQSYGIPVVRERLVLEEEKALDAAREIGYPVVLKFCSFAVSHKTEKGLVEIDLRNKDELLQALHRLKDRSQGLEGQFLLQEFIRGTRELVIGMTRDPQFGPCVMFGLGGIFTEILQDVSFRVAPINRQDAMEMMREIKGRKILEAVRGMEAVDLEGLSQSLIALGNLGLEHETVQEVDVNPLIIHRNKHVAVDALVVLREPSEKEV